MSEKCNNDCSSCGENNCDDRTKSQKTGAPQKEKLHKKSTVKKVIGVVSGKGGVGKSLVTSLMASEMARKGFKTAILDSDITGPSIPKAFGLHSKAVGDEDGIYPVVSNGGTQIMSINFLLENETDPVLWRGPILAGAVKQFWSDVIWTDVDFMFVDMPPGTGDVPLTVFQSLAVDGIIVVSTPQELVGMIVQKAVKMAETMNIPVLGLVENMSYAVCPKCGEHFNVFGESHVKEIAAQYNIPVTAQIPINPDIAKACDAGKIENIETGCLEELKSAIETL